MQLIADDMTEVRGIVLDAGASYYTVQFPERRVRVPIHLVHRVIPMEDGTSHLTIRTWFLRRMKVGTAALPTDN